mmetsp:Transcript_3951/g.10350  ORF Transcript_3951/g.10350 Transcript_3951/m.10350 type:complete len:154 (+) Transcript_3951:297-758(+)
MDFESKSVCRFCINAIETGMKPYSIGDPKAPAIFKVSVMLDENTWASTKAIPIGMATLGRENVASLFLFLFSSSPCERGPRKISNSSESDIDPPSVEPATVIKEKQVSSAPTDALEVEDGSIPPPSTDIPHAIYITSGMNEPNPRAVTILRRS